MKRKHLEYYSRSFSEDPLVRGLTLSSEYKSRFRVRLNIRRLVFSAIFTLVLLDQNQMVNQAKLTLAFAETPINLIGIQNSSKKNMQSEQARYNTLLLAQVVAEQTWKSVLQSFENSKFSNCFEKRIAFTKTLEKLIDLLITKKESLLAEAALRGELPGARRIEAAEKIEEIRRIVFSVFSPSVGDPSKVKIFYRRKTEIEIEIENVDRRISILKKILSEVDESQSGSRENFCKN